MAVNDSVIYLQRSHKEYTLEVAHEAADRTRPFFLSHRLCKYALQGVETWSTDRFHLRQPGRLSSLGYDGTRVSDFTWLTDVPLNKYEDPLKAILMGIPLTIYVLNATMA